MCGRSKYSKCRDFKNTPLRRIFNSLLGIWKCSKHAIPCLIYSSIIFIMTNGSLFIVANKANKTVVSVPKEGPQTTWQTRKVDGSPDVCGKEWQPRYQALHKDIINNKREAKFLVYICDSTYTGHARGCFGYGDRVRAVISLFYLAILTDRAFLIHWKTPKPLERFLTPKNINWTFPIPLLETRKHFWRKIYGQTKKELEDWLVRNGSALSSLVKTENFNVYFDKPVEIIASNVYLAGGAMQTNKHLMQRARDLEISPLLPGFRRHALIGCAFNFLFDIPPRLQKALQNTRKKLRENNTFVIGIHIRLGD